MWWWFKKCNLQTHVRDEVHYQILCSCAEVNVIEHLWWYNSTLVQISNIRQQAHYLCQCWPKYISLYDVTRPQWINMLLGKEQNRGTCATMAWSKTSVSKVSKIAADGLAPIWHPSVQQSHITNLTLPHRCPVMLKISPCDFLLMYLSHKGVCCVLAMSM